MSRHISYSKMELIQRCGRKTFPTHRKRDINPRMRINSVMTGLKVLLNHVVVSPPKLVFHIRLTLKIRKVSIIRCSATTPSVRYTWSKMEGRDCQMSYKVDEQLDCRYTCGVPFARKSLNKKVHCCNTVVFILSLGRIRVRNVESGSGNSRI